MTKGKKYLVGEMDKKEKKLRDIKLKVIRFLIEEWEWDVKDEDCKEIIQGIKKAKNIIEVIYEFLGIEGVEMEDTVKVFSEILK